MAEDQPTDRLAVVRWNIARHRKAAGMSQADVAEKMTEYGVKWFAQTVQKVENGTRTLRFDEAVYLARTLDIELGQLLDQPADAVAEKISADFVDARERMRAAMADYLRIQERLAILTDRVGDLGYEAVSDILAKDPLAEFTDLLRASTTSDYRKPGAMPDDFAVIHGLAEDALMNTYEPEAYGPSPEGSDQRLEELLERRLERYGTPGERWARGLDPETS